jgi:hypothetical protein
MGRCTYLTVDYGRGVKKNEVHDYSREACHAGKGVNLPRTKISFLRPPRWKGKTRPVITDPDGPFVGTTPLDDTPLEAKIGDELPTRGVD